MRGPLVVNVGTFFTGVPMKGRGYRAHSMLPKKTALFWAEGASKIRIGLSRQIIPSVSISIFWTGVWLLNARENIWAVRSWCGRGRHGRRFISVWRSTVEQSCRGI